MKRILTLLAIFLFASCTRVKPGWVGIVVNNSGTARGVQDYPVRVGRVWYNPFNEDVYEFPTFSQNVKWTATLGDDGTDDSITFNSIEGMKINTDVALSYSINGDDVPKIFVKFRNGHIDEITHKYVKNKIQEAFVLHASHMTINDIIGPRKQELIEESMKTIRKEFENSGFIFDTISFVGDMRLPESIVQSINATATAYQAAIAAQNKVKLATAEADQAIQTARGRAESNKAEAAAEGEAIKSRANAQAEANLAIAKAEADAILVKARAQAESNRLLAASTTPELINYTTITKWNGQMPTFMGGNGVTPFIDLSKVAK